jgi:SAM-dependent methyltransferase
VVNYSKVNECRLCHSKKLQIIVDFGNIPLGNNLQIRKKNSLVADKFPLCLLKCKNCSHFQLSAMVSPKLLYATNYSYLTGVAPSFISHFKKYAHWIEKKCNLNTKSKILDIGSNDGTCLKTFKKEKRLILGVDPAKLPAIIANKNGITTINSFFDHKLKNKIEKKYGKFNFITSHNVLAHVENIEDVFRSIYELLVPKGYFCFEVGYFLKVIENNFFDTIYHEHLDYHLANPLVKFLKKIGFSIISIHQNKIQGGSLRILCKKEKKVYISKVAKKFLIKESKFMITKNMKIKFWEKDIKNNLNVIENYIKEKHLSKKIIVGYGAPTKATLLMKMLNINEDILKYIIDDNPLKVNRFMPSSGIKIDGISRLKKNPPDIMIIFAWNFVSDIIHKLREKKLGKIEILVPLPIFKKIKL